MSSSASCSLALAEGSLTFQSTSSRAPLAGISLWLTTSSLSQSDGDV